MSIKVQIKQKSFFKKKLDIEKIIKLTKLSYGICDENYRLIPNEIGDHTLLYDEKKIARGIDLSLEKKDIILILSLPTSPSEIRLFYEIIEKICQEVNTTTYIREEEQVNIEENQEFIKSDEGASIFALEELQKKLKEEEYSSFKLFGVYNPLSLGQKELEEIGNNLEKLEDFFHRLQSLDVYYASPRIYKGKENIIGVYAIGPNIRSVVPLKPHILLSPKEEIKEWYVFLKEGKIIRYSDFIENINPKEYYDVDHRIITLSEKDIDTLIEKYQIEIKFD